MLPSFIMTPLSQEYSEFRHLVEPHLRPGARILELGCGNSSLGASLAAAGFDVTCTDMATTVGSHTKMQLSPIHIW